MFGIVGKQTGVMLTPSALLLARAQPESATIALRCAFRHRMSVHTTAVAAKKKKRNVKSSGKARIAPAKVEPPATVARMAPAKVEPPAIVARIDPSVPGLTLTKWEKVKAYAKFYLEGIKELWQNGRTVKEIRARVQAGGAGVSRKELQIQVRHAQDKVRLVPFVLLVLLLEEISLLVLMVVPSLCPSTCVTYGHALSVAKKHDAVKLGLQAAALERIKGLGLEAAAFGSSETIATLSKTHADSKLFVLSELTRSDLQLVSRFMGVTGRIATPISTTNRLRNLLLNHLEYLQQDDRLLVKEKLMGQLPPTELHAACQERGIPSAGYSDDDLNKALLSWTTLSSNCRSAEDMMSIVWSRLVLFNKVVGA
ncbi:hypothetical protein EV175_000774 [Coemansia sp. RSA 1933]|nr:hypothetical protein EV175_000774 [Coemansia sp. RSA 1933]